jgi:catechol-2,3-dioxygenase
VILRSTAGLQLGLTVFDRSAGDDAFDPSRIGLDHAGLLVAGPDELDAWAAHLDALGIAYDGPREAPLGWLLVAHDPDGIPVEWYAPKS